MPLALTFRDTVGLESVMIRQTRRYLDSAWGAGENGIQQWQDFDNYTVVDTGICLKSGPKQFGSH